MIDQRNWLDLIPVRWQRKKLKYVASLKSGDSITSDDITEVGEYPVFGGNGVRGYTSTYTHCGHYVLIGRQGALCGNINYASGCFWASEHAVVATIKDDNDVIWLGELLRSMNLNQYSQSAAQPGIAVDVIANLEIPVPPPREQRAIADYLRHETGRLDALIVAKGRLLGLLTEKRQALISHAVTYGLDPRASLRKTDFAWPTDVPEHWNVLRLKWIVVNVESGVSVNATDHPAARDELGVLKTSAVSQGRFVATENKAVWISEANRVACPVHRDTVIISRMNTPALVAESGYVHQDYPNLFLPDRLWQITFNSKRAWPRFISQVLACSGARAAFSAMATGTSGSMKNLAQEDMLSLPIPLPPMDEQRGIVSFIDAESAKLISLHSATERTIALLTERRAALIAAAVTGQIDIGSAA